MSNEQPDFYEDRAEERAEHRRRPPTVHERLRLLQEAENRYERELDRLGGSL